GVLADETQSSAQHAFPDSSGRDVRRHAPWAKRSRRTTPFHSRSGSGTRAAQLYSHRSEPRSSSVRRDWSTRGIYAREIYAELASAFFEKVRQQETHLEKRQWILPRPHQLVPGVGRRRHHGRRGNVFVPRAWSSSSRCTYRTYQHGQELQRARHLP